MNEKTKREKEIAAETKEKIKDENKNSAARDHLEKKYYYDDAHGYEVYDPETNSEENDEN